MRTNKVVNVLMAGGWVGLFSSPRKRIERALLKQNADGWTVRQVLPPNLNPLFILIALLCLAVTCTVYMPLPGYTVMEKDTP